MAKELAKQYDPSEVEDRTYQFWCDKKYFHAKREKGKKENSITKQQFMEWTKSIWTMNAESARRIGHPAPFPEELPYRLIQLYSIKGDIILDPFMGSGTTAVSAIKSDRKFVGYDISQEYIDLAEKRLKPFLEQTTLKFTTVENNKEQNHCTQQRFGVMAGVVLPMRVLWQLQVQFLD